MTSPDKLTDIEKKYVKETVENETEKLLRAVPEMKDQKDEIMRHITSSISKIAVDEVAERRSLYEKEIVGVLSNSDTPRTAQAIFGRIKQDFPHIGSIKNLNRSLEELAKNGTIKKRSTQCIPLWSM